MENRFADTIINIICYIIITATLLSACLFIIDDINANAQEPNTITLLAGTYTFNDELNGFDVLTMGNEIPMDIVYNGISYNQILAYPINYLEYNIDFVSFFDTVNTNTEAEIYIKGTIDGVEYQGFIVDTPVEFVVVNDTIVELTFGNWFIANTNYNVVNGYNATTIPYINVNIPTDIQIMENINMDINGFGSTTSNDNVGLTALNGDTLGRIRTNDDTFISFNGIAVTSFDSRRTLSTYVYPLTDDVIATQPFTISNGLMLYVWDDTQYYQVAWYNPADELWYVHGDYAIIVPYGHRSTQGIGTLTDGIAISLSITPNLTADDIGYVELGGFEDTPPYDNIITVADEDAFSTFAMFCNANFISDSEKLAWGIAQHQSGQNLGQSQQLGENILGQFLQAPIDILDSIVIYTTPNGTAVTLMGVFGALLTLSLVIIFLKLFAGG